MRGVIVDENPNPAPVSPDSPDSLDARSLEALEWRLVTESLAARARCALGQDLASQHTPFPTLAESRRLRERVLEGQVLLEKSSVHACVDGATDVAAPLDRAAREGVLSPTQIYGCSRFLMTVGLLGSELRGRREHAPKLCEDFTPAPAVPAVCERVTRSIAPDGAILDTASVDLQRLRREKASRRVDFENTLQARVKQWSAEGLLQDSFYDQVDGRYVVPVKVGEQSKLDGSLVGRSNTGQSVFIEPAELRVASNALTELDLAIKAEEHRILRALSRELGSLAPSFLPWLEPVAELDLALAAARLAKDWELEAPNADATSPNDAAAGGRLAVTELFHPGLRDRATVIVKNTFSLDAGGRALLISGPNTGGKTVLLKAAALGACMARAGLLVPASKGSHVPHYSGVIALIGDEQSLSAGLSSFSAQIKDLRAVIERQKPGALVVIDEILSSTDPEEASALAQSVIEELVVRGHHVIVTSHFSDLSLRARAIPSVTVAAMEFDQGRPTYRLRPGELGTSHALEVAEKLGFPTRLIARARALMSTAKLDYERATSDLKARESELKSREVERSIEHAQRLALADREREKMKLALRAEVDAFMARAQASFNDAVQAITEKLTDKLAATTRQSGSKSAKPDALAAAAKQAAAGVAAAADGLKSLLGAPAREAAAEPMPLVVGATVKIRSMAGARATVLEVKNSGDHDDARVILQCGTFRLEKRASDLEVIAAPKNLAAAQSRRNSYVNVDSEQVARKLDVRGQRYDEALANCERYIDQAFRSGAAQITIVTGHGTGALKKGLRELLVNLPYVREHRAEREGDDGATLIEFDR